MHSDPIADTLTRIRNGTSAKLDAVEIPLSKMKVEVVRILEAEGFVKSHEVVSDRKFPVIKVLMKYDVRRQPIMTHLKRVSKPGLRVYKSCKDLRPVRGGLGTQILSTNLGVMTDREARKRGVGGEVICEVW